MYFKLVTPTIIIYNKVFKFYFIAYFIRNEYLILSANFIVKAVILYFTDIIQFTLKFTYNIIALSELKYSFIKSLYSFSQ